MAKTPKAESGSAKKTINEVQDRKVMNNKKRGEIMGNRAVITTPAKKIGIYLHWNGGRDSIEAFLKYCELKEYRSPSEDCYGWARLCQVIGNFFGGSTSIGMDKLDQLDCENQDNGVYVISGWNIVRREYFKGIEQKYHDICDMLSAIDEKQPPEEQISDQINNYIAEQINIA